MYECFTALGYDCDWKILNAANFGVPQRRERLIFIGVEKGAKIRFPTPTHYSNGATIGHRDHSKMLLAEDDLFTPRHVLKPAVTVMDAIGDLPQIKSGRIVRDLHPVTDYRLSKRKAQRLQAADVALLDGSHA